MPIAAPLRRRGARVRFAALVSALALGMGGLSVMSAEAAVSIPLPGLTAAWVGVESDILDNAGVPCLRVDPLGSNTEPAETAAVPNGATAHVGHGFALTYDSAGNPEGTCLSAFDPGEQSNLGFTPMAPASAEAGATFLLGHFVHNNNPVARGQQVIDYHMTGGLQITMGTFTDTFPFTLTETANLVNGAESPVSDVTAFDSVRSTQLITGTDGLNYRLVIQGFYPEGAGGTCPATPTGAVTQQFVAPENASTGGCLYASWEQIRAVIIVKTVLPAYGSPDTVPAFNYTIQQYVDGGFATPTEFWRNDTGWKDFSLTPDWGTDATRTGELLLPVDGMRVTETDPGYTPAAGGWKLTDLVCVDGTGAPVLDNSGAPIRVDLATGEADLANVAPATTAAQAAITCTYTFFPGAALSIVKTINGQDANEVPGVIVDPGSTLSIEFTVTNTGNRPISDVTVSDDTIAAADIVAPATKLGWDGVTVEPFDGWLFPGESAVFTATYPAPAAGVQHTNVAIAEGNLLDPADPDYREPISSEPDPGNARSSAPHIQLDKIATLPDGKTQAQVGDTVTYSFVVTNTGGVVLAPVTITDAKFGLLDAACVDSLAIAETATCSTTVEHVVTAADLAEGEIINVAIATGTAPDDTEVTDDDTEIVPVVGTPGILLDKWTTLHDANNNKLADAGELLVYQFDVTNTGNVTLTPVTITDPKFNLTDAACVATLAPGETATCTTTVEYTVTAADVAAGGYIVNTAVATGTVPGSDTPVTSQDTVEVPVGPKPATPDKPTALPRTGSEASSSIVLVSLLSVLGMGAGLRRRG